MHVEAVIIIVPAAARIIFLIMKSLKDRFLDRFHFCAKNEMTHLDECQNINILFAFKIHFSIAHKLKPGNAKNGSIESRTKSDYRLSSHISSLFLRYRLIDAMLKLS